MALLLLRTSGGEEVPQGRWLSLLALIPDTEVSRDGVAMNDHGLARELFGIERPAADVDEEGLIDYISALGVVIRPAELLVNMMMSPDASRSELGFTIAEVDFDASVLDAREPGATGNSFTLLPGYEIVRGRIDERTVEEALRTDPTFSDLLEQTSYNGTDYFHWGQEGGVDLTRQTMLRLLGEGRQLVIRDGTLYWTELEEDIENIIDAAGGNRASLAGRKEYQLVALALDGLGTYTAYLSSDTANDLAGWEGSDASPDDLAPELALVPYELIATGRALDSEGGFLAVVLVHDDEDDAAENVIRLGQRIEAAGHISSVARGEPVPRWSEVITAEIVQDGRLLIAKLYPNDGDVNRFRFSPFATLLLQE
ncbi:MAG: hypothetical protein IIB22_11980 [Chloroflexi bacterium]|nr:hypothetical protein [Chloroflexota bacterium]